MTMDKTPYSSFKESSYKKLNVYDLTYSLSYDGEDYNFSISQRTVRLYSINPIVDFSGYEMKIKEQVASIFRGNSRLFVENHIKVTPTLISDTPIPQESTEENKKENINLRGIEQVNYYDNLKEDKKTELLNNGFTYYDLNQHEGVKVKKNNNVNRYKVNLWL